MANIATQLRGLGQKLVRCESHAAGLKRELEETRHALMWAVKAMSTYEEQLRETMKEELRAELAREELLRKIKMSRAQPKGHRESAPCVLTRR